MKSSKVPEGSPLTASGTVKQSKGLKPGSPVSKNGRKSLSPARSSSASRVRKCVGSRVPIDNNEELSLKIDFLMKKTKTLEVSLQKFKAASESDGDNSHQWAIHLSDMVKMDKHNIADIRDEVNGIKQRLHRLAQKESQERVKEKSTADTKIDIGSITEQVFNRVHREFTQVVDEVVRSCVLEHAQSICRGADRHTEETEQYRELKGQISELKRRQQVLEDSLSARGGETYIYMHWWQRVRCSALMLFYLGRGLPADCRDCTPQNGRRQPARYRGNESASPRESVGLSGGYAATV